MAEVIGGPDDGCEWLSHDFITGDTFVPAKTANNRPIYRFLKCDGEKDQFIFGGWDHA